MSSITPSQQPPISWEAYRSDQVFNEEKIKEMVSFIDSEVEKIQAGDSSVMALFKFFDDSSIASTPLKELTGRKRKREDI